MDNANVEKGLTIVRAKQIIDNLFAWAADHEQDFYEAVLSASGVTKQELDEISGNPIVDLKDDYLKKQLFAEKITKDFKEAIDRFTAHEKMLIVWNAKEISHMQQIDNFLEAVLVENTFLSTETIDKIINCKTNVFEKIYDVWDKSVFQNHYNFFVYKDLAKIITNVFEQD